MRGPDDAICSAESAGCRFVLPITGCIESGAENSEAVDVTSTAVGFIRLKSENYNVL